MAEKCTIVWFRRDLRLEDNPALSSAARAGSVLPVFIWSPKEEGQFCPGRASRWWLKQSLSELSLSLRRLGAPLVMVKTTDTLATLLELVRKTGSKQVFYNHLYDPVSLVRDHRIKQCLLQNGIQVQSFSGDLLYEPWEVLDDNGNPFITFESYWEKCLNMPHEPQPPLLPPRKLVAAPGDIASLRPEDLGLEEETDKSSNALLARAWRPGWCNADRALEAFLAGPLLDYSQNRHKIDVPTTSLLSPHLHYGEVSVKKVFHSVRSLQILWAKDGSMLGEESIKYFMRAIGFREYSRYLCFNFPFTHERSLLSNLNSFPWRVDEGLFKAWRQGRTGYPLVDAGMRELWATGWLHNRVRVIVASFCVKFLQLPWRWGMKYFWDTLLDADLESDILGWQYISGSLPDGHELDRMDNPQIEGYKHDPLGEYVRRWLPELTRLPREWIHHPWDAPPAVLRAAGVELGSNYPRPVVEIVAAKERLREAIGHMWQEEAALKGDKSCAVISIKPAGNKENAEFSMGHVNAEVSHSEATTKPSKASKSGDTIGSTGHAEASSSVSSHCDQMVPTFTEQHKPQADPICGDSDSVAKHVGPQQAVSRGSAKFVSAKGISKGSLQKIGSSADTSLASRQDAYTLVPPLASDTDSMAGSSSSPQKQIKKVKDGTPVSWVPMVTQQRSALNFSNVLSVHGAEKVENQPYSTQTPRANEEVEDEMSVDSSQWTRGSKRKAK
ncbi:hypothetical protein KP509_32G056000 [Ceratopteris richardii]|uniref:Cryptochrome 3 n=2 Tax=Ceratopteris richardii TaxID=49495 RepID=A0A6M6C9W4_CERRI|nr:hypothetical protein KP509_32G056000 [Ceratopteris richardii]KAH7287432.1 hypothetical protein KP509_32G056000 [Ceratopteris richardii]QJX57315.1 cryptochrome 3 [Ceratopteris richardii]